VKDFQSQQAKQLLPLSEEVPRINRCARMKSLARTTQEFTEEKNGEDKQGSHVSSKTFLRKAMAR